MRVKSLSRRNQGQDRLWTALSYSIKTGNLGQLRHLLSEDDTVLARMKQELIASLVCSYINKHFRMLISFSQQPYEVDTVVCLIFQRLGLKHREVKQLPEITPRKK